MAQNRRSHVEQQRHNRWATLQWAVLGLLIVLASLAAFVLVDGSGATGGHLN